jgi:hypothetical protein
VLKAGLDLTKGSVERDGGGRAPGEGADLLKRAAAFFGERDPVICYRIVPAQKARIPVPVTCELLGVSTSGFYAWASSRAV